MVRNMGKVDESSTFLIMIGKRYDIRRMQESKIG